MKIPRMRVATLRDGSRDGALAVVSADGARLAEVPDLPTLQSALDDWPSAHPVLEEACTRLEEAPRAGWDAASARLEAPLPRAYQWAEASSYHSHMERIRRARGIDLPPDHGTAPAAYNSGSDSFLGPVDPIPLADPAWGLDLEATIAVITDDVPVGTTPDDAVGHVRFVVLINDLTLRNLISQEYQRGVGFFQAKPRRSVAPFAATPEFLGEAWDGRLLHATVSCAVNGEALGSPDAGVDCAFDFSRVISHMTRTRPLAAGSIIGSGTVSNRDASVGFAAIAEKRAVEMTEGGEATTAYLGIGDKISIEAVDASGRSLFGAIDQEVVAAPEGDAR